MAGFDDDTTRLHHDGMTGEFYTTRDMAAMSDEQLLAAHEATNDGAFLNELESRRVSRKEETALQQLPGAIYAVPDYSLCQIRLNCLSMALASPEGLTDRPLAEVIERARAYWAFVKGE